MAPEDEKTLTIAQRTVKNLKYIYSQKEQAADVEEFTQLLNSMFGVLICLREDFIKGDNVSWENILDLNLGDKIKNLDKIKGHNPSNSSPKLEQIKTFSKLVSNLRNGFAHNNFELKIETTSKKITGIIIWNTHTGKPNIRENRIWEADFSEDNLKNIAFLVLEYVEKALGVSKN